MRVRKLDANLDMTFGKSQGNFYRDQPEAPAQVALSRLYLFLGEWWLDTSDGTAWNTKVLGKFTGSTRDAVIRARLLGTPGVSGVVTYASQLDRNARAFSVQATLNTVFGVAPLPNVPQ